MGFWAARVTGLTTLAMKRWAREVALSMEQHSLRSRVERGGTRPCAFFAPTSKSR